MSEWGDCFQCKAEGSMELQDWGGYECSSCDYISPSWNWCPDCVDQRVATPACGCGTCVKCGYRFSCVYIPSHIIPLEINPVLGTHTWVSYFRDEAPYECNCGLDFDTHEKLMEHTMAFNPPIESYELGRAGVFIERTAHEKTLERLKTAMDLLQEVVEDVDDWELPTSDWRTRAMNAFPELIDPLADNAE